MKSGLASIMIMLLISVLSTSCTDNSATQPTYTTFPTDSWEHIEFIDQQKLLVIGRLPGRHPVHGIYRVSIDSIGDLRAYSLLASTTHLKEAMNISGTLKVRGLVGSEHLLMSGDTERGGKAVGLYSMKTRELMWLTPPEEVNEYLGWTRGRSAVLMSHMESMHNGKAAIVISPTPTLLELNIFSGITRKVFHSPEFRYRVNDTAESCEPFVMASGSPGGEHIVLIGRKFGSSCKPYLIIHAGTTKEQLRELTVSTHIANPIWYPDGQRFLMHCGESTVCQYTADGVLGGLYRFPQKNFFLADYYPPSDTVLMRHYVSPFDTTIGMAAIATYYFDARVEPPSWRFRLHSWWYSWMYK